MFMFVAASCSAVGDLTTPTVTQHHISSALVLQFGSCDQLNVRFPLVFGYLDDTSEFDLPGRRVDTALRMTELALVQPF